MATKFAQGKKSVAISDISGAKVPYTQLKTTWNNLRVEPSEYDPKHPQLTPAQNVVDATALRNPRPDTDVENVEIILAFTANPFQSRLLRSQQGIGIKGQSAIGFVQLETSETVTGLAGTGAIGTAAAGFDVSGVNATGNIGTVTPQDEISATPTGLAGVGAIGTAQTGAVVSGVNASGAIGTEAINHDRIFELPNGGVEGSSGIGTSAPQTDVIGTGVNGTGATGTVDNNNNINANGVAGTGALGTFGESGDATLNLTVQGVGAAGTAGVGSEVAESEIREANNTGFGEQEWSYGTWGGDPEIVGVGATGTVTLDIFKGPILDDGVAGTGATGNFIVQGNLNVTGVEGTGAIGSATINQEFNATGIAGTGRSSLEAGFTVVQVDPGFGEGSWSEGDWGE